MELLQIRKDISVEGGGGFLNIKLSMDGSEIQLESVDRKCFILLD